MSWADNPHAFSTGHNWKQNTFKVFSLCFNLFKFFTRYMKGEVLPLALQLQRECLVHFLRVTRAWRASSPSLKPIHFPCASSQNFEIAILFSIVERSSNYVFTDIRHVNPPSHNYAISLL